MPAYPHAPSLPIDPVLPLRLAASLRATCTAAVVGLAALVALPASAQVRYPEGIGLYVGVDGLGTLSTGTYAGLPNPNGGRLTLLLDHGNHYHGIGSFRYTGPAASPTIVTGNNRIPEGARPALPVFTGSGIYGGRWVSGVSNDPVLGEYSYLGMASTQSLPAFGAPGVLLFGSSAGRWDDALGAGNGIPVGLELLSATPGLLVGNATDTNLFDSGNVISLGFGNTLEFLPVYSIDGQAAAGIYSAEFRLVDLSGQRVFGDSGNFRFDFAVVPVPVPGSLALLLPGLAALGLAVRRRRA